VRTVVLILSIPIQRYLREEEGLGTAGGLHKYRTEICEGLSDDSHLFVLHCDILCPMPLQQVLDFHKSHSKTATVVCKQVPDELARLYGCLVFDKDTREVLHYTEKPETFVCATDARWLVGWSSWVVDAMHAGQQCGQLRHVLVFHVDLPSVATSSNQRTTSNKAL
jgi:ADP-glucose pyrophosphorylase